MVYHRMSGNFNPQDVGHPCGRGTNTTERVPVADAKLGSGPKTEGTK